VQLSLAMEEASGIPFEEYVRTRVLEPLGMFCTYPEIPDADSKYLATFYSRDRRGFRKAIPVDNRYKLAGGGYLSTSADIARLGQAYLDGNIKDKGLLSQFLTSVYIEDKPTWYGLGWQVSRDKQGRPFYGHVGNAIGGYAIFFVYPGERTVFAILVNCTSPGVQEELDEVIACLLPEQTFKTSS
jgi:CubicO group peptidase (beta-lactamase class C family)